ncbi:hypothetical protein GCM10009827_101550 [Dactylosporangium maewongense]|uniref:HTH cro/C1-type domain-containing protein n=1 Tax=Dactylosporangium maewongense TaxID=634393 RepID=A0ABP4NMU0_9ACTN
MNGTVDTAELAPGEQLRQLLPQWRRRIRPKDIPGLLYGNASPTKKFLSQENVAHLTGVSVRWYADLERGRAAAYSEEFIKRLALALRLSREERAVLYMLVLGREPDPPRAIPVGEQFAALRTIVDAQPWPAYVSDDAWDVLFCNEHMARWFPHLDYEPNIMAWPFLYPESKLQLVNQLEVWYPPMLAQLRAAIARHPDNERLQEVIRQILEQNADARRIWDEDAEVHLHPDGDRRLMHVPDFDGPELVEIVAMTALRAVGFRVMMLIPVDRVNRATP